MSEITAVKNDIFNFISEKSTLYSISEQKMVEMIQAIFFEKEFISALNNAETDKGIVINKQNSNKIIEDLKLKLTKK